MSDSEGKLHWNDNRTIFLQTQNVKLNEKAKLKHFLEKTKDVHQNQKRLFQYSLFWQVRCLSNIPQNIGEIFDKI